jgi:hypothetical protein
MVCKAGTTEDDELIDVKDGILWCTYINILVLFSRFEDNVIFKNKNILLVLWSASYCEVLHIPYYLFGIFYLLTAVELVNYLYSWPSLEVATEAFA